MFRCFIFIAVALASVGCVKDKCNLTPAHMIECAMADTIDHFHFGAVQDFSLVGNKMIVHTGDNRILSIMLETPEVAASLVADSAETFTMMLDGTIYFSKSDRSISKKSCDGANEEQIARVDSVIHLLRFNSKGEGFAITENGIFSLKHGALLFPDSLPNNPFTIGQFWWEPSCAFIDSKERLWIGFDYGEWGGNVVCFDTNLGSFRPIEFDTSRFHLPPVTSLFEGKEGVVYATTGVTHGNTIGGSIYAIKELHAEMVYNGFVQDGYSGEGNGEYIGAGVFDDERQNILYFSGKGFSYASHEEEFCSSVFFTPMLVRPTSGRAAYPREVKKIAITDRGGILFLSKTNGIGYLRSQRLTFFK